MTSYHGALPSLHRLQFAKHPYWHVNLNIMLRPARSCMVWRVYLSLSLHRLWVWARQFWPVPAILIFFLCAVKSPFKGHTEGQEKFRNIEGILWRDTKAQEEN